MAMAAAVRWTLTVIFAVTTSYCVGRCGFLAKRGVRHQVTAWILEVSHIAMSASTIAMVWAGVAWDRWGVQLTLFGLLGGWFGVRGLLGGQPDHAHPMTVTRPALLYESTAAGAMCWMLVSMRPSRGGDALTPHDVAMPDMAGMTLTCYSCALTATLAAVLSLSAAAWVLQFRRVLIVGAIGEPAAAPARNTATIFGAQGEAACQVLIAVGMAALLLTLL